MQNLQHRLHQTDPIAICFARPLLEHQAASVLEHIAPGLHKCVHCLNTFRELATKQRTNSLHQLKETCSFCLPWADSFVFFGGCSIFLFVRNLAHYVKKIEDGVVISIDNNACDGSNIRGIVGSMLVFVITHVT